MLAIKYGEASLAVGTMRFVNKRRWLLFLLLAGLLASGGGLQMLGVEERTRLTQAAFKLRRTRGGTHE